MDEAKLDTIDWTLYRTAYGIATNVPGQLRRLASADHEEAMRASHDLWCGLCHQHAYVSSAALPALPFLLDVLLNANETLTAEILDILLGFAICTSPTHQPDLPPWTHQLREQLKMAFPRFEHLAQDPNEEIADFAAAIKNCLAAL